MNQDKKIASFPVKKLLFVCVTTFATLFLFLALASFLLLKLEHFERFYNVCCYVVWGLEALFLSVNARLVKSRPTVFAATSALIIAVLFFAAALILSAGKTDYLEIGLRLSFYLVVSVLLTLFPVQNGGKKKRRFKR